MIYDAYRYNLIAVAIPALVSKGKVHNELSVIVTVSAFYSNNRVTTADKSLLDSKPGSVAIQRETRALSPFRPRTWSIVTTSNDILKPPPCLLLHSISPNEGKSNIPFTSIRS